MERTIKFRGIASQGELIGKWVYGGLFHDSDKNYLISIAVFPKSGMVAKCLVNPDSVGEFTGLTDCKGKEIFEGDIVTYFNTFVDVHDNSHYVKLLQGCVQWNDGAFVIVNPDDNSTSLLIGRVQYFGDVTVVGNRYNNPDMLGGIVSDDNGMELSNI